MLSYVQGFEAGATIGKGSADRHPQVAESDEALHGDRITLDGIERITI